MKKFLVLILFYTGCETIVDIDIPKDEPRLVLNGFFNPDSTLSVSLFQSLGILETNEFKIIEDASVSVFDENGVEQAKLTHEGSGKYTSVFKPEIGKMYRVETSKNGFKTIEGSDIIPVDSMRISSISLERTGETFEGQLSGEYDIDFTIDDYSGEDFYEIHVLQWSIYEYEGVRYDYKTYQYLESEDVVFDDFTSSGIGLLFNDALFDEKKSTITINTFLYLDENCDLSPDCISNEFFLVARKVSEAYYNYIRTLRLQQDLEGNPFAEPVTVFDNITNGFGIFAGYRDNKYLLEVLEN